MLWKASLIATLSSILDSQHIFKSSSCFDSPQAHSWILSKIENLASYSLMFSFQSTKLVSLSVALLARLVATLSEALILNPSCAQMRARVGYKIRFDQPTRLLNLF